jgi:outer membrane protein TolC
MPASHTGPVLGTLSPSTKIRASILDAGARRSAYRFCRTETLGAPALRSALSRSDMISRVMLSRATRWSSVLLVVSPAVAGADTPAPASTGALRLADAVQLALARNERARISDLNVTVADAGVERARAAFFPIVTFTASDAAHAKSLPGQPSNAATGALTLTQPIVNASAWPLYAQARELASQARAQGTDDKRVLAFNAASAFFVVLGAQAVVQAAQRQVENARANLADTQARVDAQLASSNDVTRTRVDMASAEREAAADAGTLANAYVQLSFVLNAAVSGPLEPPAPTLQAAQEPTGAADALVRFAVAHRPDVLASRSAASAAHDFAGEPLLRLVPTLGVTGTASGTTAPPGTAKQWNDESLTANLTWTLFDQGARYADKRARDAQAAIADLNLQALERSVRAQVEGAIDSLAAAQSAFQVAHDAMLAAEQNVDETAILYRQGLAKAIELVDANDQRFTAEIGYAGAEYAMAQAYLALREALGLDPLGTETPR